MKKKQIILNKERIKNTINRIAFSIIEDYHEEKSITLIGFDKNGYIIAKKIKKITESNNISTIVHRIKKDKKNHFKITPKLSSDNLKNVFLVEGKKMSTIEERVKKITIEQLGVSEEEVKNEASFVDDLGADSLDTVELVMALEEEFDTEIPDEEAEKITTVQAAIDYVNANQ